MDFSALRTITWLFALGLLGVCGCGPKSASQPAAPEQAAQPLGGPWREELFTYAIDNLNRLEEFEPGGMLPQIVDRLDQWARVQPSPATWKADPMLEELPKALAELPAVKSLDALAFSADDGSRLQEAVLLRDASNAARGPEIDDLQRARRLFDWTVRNIQLERADAGSDNRAAARPRQTPGQTLLFGSGSVWERAWVLILLARQQGIEAAVLAIPPEQGSADAAPWAVGVLAGGEIYLFDPLYGLPLPAPDSPLRGASGQLDVFPATLAQAASNDQLLHKMDAGPEHAYPVRAARLAKVSVLLEASPAYLSKRMKLLESRLAGKQKVVLTTQPSAVAAKWKACPQVANVRLWPFPYETLLAQSKEQPSLTRIRLWRFLTFRVGPPGGLWKGRLQHLKGVLSGEDGATGCYQLARPANADVVAGEAFRREAYSKSMAQAKPHAPAASRQDDARIQAQVETAAIVRAKQDASFWLGLVAFERGNFASAIDYFQTRTLQAWPDGPWSVAASYNLGRSYEAAGETAKAIAQYRADASHPDGSGQLVRAQWLEMADQKGTAPATPK